MATLTKKQLWKENDEWVVVGLKQNKSVEKGWVLVPDKSKGKPVDEPDRVDKILARYAERETDVRPSPLVEALFQSQNTQNAALPRPRRHGVCKRSEAKAFLRHGRVTFEGDVVTRPEQRVVVRYVRGPSARTARLPASGTTWTFSPRRLFFCFFVFLAKRLAKRRRSRRVPPFPPAGCTTACTWTTSPSPSRTSPTRRTSTGSRRRDEARRVTQRETEAKDPLLPTRVFELTYLTRYLNVLFPLLPSAVPATTPRASARMTYKTNAVATFVASSPATAAARERSGVPSRTPARVAGRAPRSDPAINPRARRARRPRTLHPAANRAAFLAPATDRPATPAPPALAR